MSVVEFEIRTQARDGMTDITEQVAQTVRDSGVAEGIAVVYCPHTTAGITINENADPDVVHDVLGQLNEIAPWRAKFYDHGEGNSAAHVKSSIVGASETIPISGGRLVLGTWQGIFFCEFDGPRRRRFLVTVLGK